MRIWLSSGLLVASLAGCQSSGPKMPYADNPLLLSREPLLQSQAKAKTPPPAAPTSWSRNTLPAKAGTPTEFAAKQVTSAPLAPITANKPADPPKLIAPPPPQAESINVTTFSPINPPAPPPAPVETKFEAIKETIPAPQPAVAAPVVAPIQQAAYVAPTPRSRLDAAADFSWIQGEIDCHYRGHKELRFRSPAEEDALGGKVRLMDDAMLGDVRTGDVVLVEGELIRDEGNGQARYRVRTLRVVERGR